MNAKRRLKTQKFDSFTSPDASAKETACHIATAPFDHAAESYDRKWGIDRLPGLVAPALAARYGEALGQLNEAIREQDAELVAQKAAACIRGMAKMDEVAEAAGHPHADPGIIEYELDGWKFGIMTDPRAWKGQPKAAYPVFSLREVALALKERGANHPLIETAKEHFPGAEIVSFDRNKDLEDEIPWE